MSDLVTRAEAFAKRAHGSQMRKYNGEPYWLHLREVAMLVESVGGTEAQVASAWLHDTVEDTAVTMAEVVAEFGCEVGILVDDLTDISKPEDGNRETRRRIDREHTATIHEAAKTVKLADLISNSSSIGRHDKDFAVVYMREKRQLLPHLTEGNGLLFAIASDIVRRYFEERHETT